MYTHIQNAEDLKTAIEELKEREKVKKQAIADNFHAFTDSMKPANLIRNSFKSNGDGSPGIAGTVIKAGIGMGVGLLSKKLLIGSSTNIFKTLAGNAVKLGVAGVVAKKTDRIKYAGLKLLTKVLGRKKSKKILG
ncbi:MAG: hypothetical protein Q7T76_18135 [Ferruginibacter sp.]|nr:hypothetical protein [Ferruginibacter sp.]